MTARCHTNQVDCFSGLQKTMKFVKFDIFANEIFTQVGFRDPQNPLAIIFDALKKHWDKLCTDIKEIHNLTSTSEIGARNQLKPVLS